MAVHEKKHREHVKEMQATLHALWKQGKAEPYQAHANWAQHVFREDNSKADYWANQAMNGKPQEHHHNWRRHWSSTDYYRISFFSEGERKLRG